MTQVITLSAKLVALPEAEVSVKNYRLRPERWEDGKVLRATTNWRINGETYNSYEVLLDRRSAAGNGIRVTVGDDEVVLR